MRGQPLERPSKIARIVRGEAKLGALAHHASKPIQHVHLDETALVMPRLGPRIRKEDEYAAEASGRHRFYNVACIALMDPDASAQGLVLGEFREQLRNAELVGLCPKHANLDVLLHLPDEMLATAEAYLQPDIIDRIGKIFARIPTRLEPKRELRQQLRSQMLLMCGKLGTFPAAV